MALLDGCDYGQEMTDQVIIRGKKILLKKNAEPKLKGERYFFYEPASQEIVLNALNLRFKSLLRKFPKLYEFLRNVYYPVLIVTGKNRAWVKRREPAGSVILNLASGSNTDSQFINVDLGEFPGVDIIADVCNLPFEDGIADWAIFESSLEHVYDFEKALDEIHRVLKPRGGLFITVPFIMGFHESPSDYWRWTKEGLKVALRKFRLDEIGNKGGPASAFGWVFAEFVAIALSFDLPWLHFLLFHLVLLLISPLKLLDFLLARLNLASNISSMFYAIAYKEN